MINFHLAKTETLKPSSCALDVQTRSTPWTCMWFRITGLDENCIRGQMSQRVNNLMWMEILRPASTISVLPRCSGKHKKRFSFRGFWNPTQNGQQPFAESVPFDQLYSYSSRQKSNFLPASTRPLFWRTEGRTLFLLRSTMIDAPKCVLVVVFASSAADNEAFAFSSTCWLELKQIQLK